MSTSNSTTTSRATRLGIWLVGTTLLYNIIEAAIALVVGVSAESIALLGFGFDSVIEVAAAIMVLWRLSLESGRTEASSIRAAEHRVHRFVGWTFFALALYVIVEAGLDLWRQEAPEESTIGIILAATSLVLMPLVSLWKFRVADQLQSAALRAEAKETLACSYLSLTLLLGLVAHAKLGWAWADPVAALLMVPWLVKEGFEGLQGQHCCS